jgi:hypothetical protein
VILRKRYLTEKTVTSALVTLIRRKFPSPALERLSYFHAARAGQLLYDTVTETLAPLRASGLMDHQCKSFAAVLETVGG